MNGDICKHMKVGDECDDCDREFTISQAFPNAQPGSKISNNDKANNDKDPMDHFKLALTDSIKEYNDYLITKNNSTNEDAGVHEGIIALEDASQKAVKKLHKDKVLATLGFLKRKTFGEAKELYKKILVEDLRMILIEEYRRMSPQACEECKIIFNQIESMNSYAECFICLNKICPKCLPHDHENNHKGLIPACNGCQGKHRNKAKNANTNRDDNRDKSKENDNNDKKENENEIVIQAEVHAEDDDGEFVEVKKKERKQNKNKDIEEKKEDEKKEKICIHYLARRCRHGRKGKDCEYKHPKLCFAFMDKGKEGCDKEDCNYHHPAMCKWEDKCKKEKCKYLHPRLNRRDGPKKCKYDDKCNKEGCKFAHTERKSEVVTKVGEKTEAAEKHSTNEKVDKEVEVVKNPEAAKDFRVDRGEDPQIKDLKTMMESLVKNVSTLMEERAMLWNWGHYYQH